MSDLMTVFLHSNKLPHIEEIRKALKQKGLELESWEEDKLEDIEGFWPGIYNGEEAGFEFLLSQITDEDLEDWEINKKQLNGCDYILELAFYSE